MEGGSRVCGQRELVVRIMDHHVAVSSFVGFRQLSLAGVLSRHDGLSENVAVPSQFVACLCGHLYRATSLPTTARQFQGGEVI